MQSDLQTGRILTGGEMLTKRNAKKTVIYILAVVWLLTSLMPLIYAIMTSLKTNEEIYRSALQLPKSWLIENYITANQLGHSVRSIGNSLFVSLMTTVGEIVVAMLASYAISRKSHIFFVRHAYMLFVAGVMIPIHSTLIPISSMAANLGMKNSFFYLIMVYICFNLAQGVFLFTGFLNSVSREIDEAAIIDGCGDIQLLGRVLLPICKPIIATEAIFSFMYAYGELIFSLTLISDSGKYTVPRAMLSFWGEFQSELGPQYAFIVISSIPTILIYILFHNQIQSGVMTGSVKE